MSTVSVPSLPVGEVNQHLNEITLGLIDVFQPAPTKEEVGFCFLRINPRPLFISVVSHNLQSPI